MESKKRSKLCFGLLLVFCTIFGALFVGCSDTSAASLQTSIYNVWYRRYANESFTRLSDISTGYSNGFNATALRWYEFKSVPVTTTGQYASLHFETNIVYSRGANEQGGIGEYNFVNGTYMNTLRCWLGSTRLRIISQSLSFSSTPWRGTSPGGIPLENITRTWYGDVSLADIPLNVTDNIICEIGSDEFNMFDTTVGSPNLLYIPWLWFEQNPADITFTYSATESQLGGLSEQQQIIIQQNQEMIDKENQSISNIENQSSSDISGAENQQTTNIIGILTTFVTTLSSVQSGSCELTLPFPAFAGGNVLANPCSYKEKAPEIVTIGSSLLLIGVFIPLAYIVLKMIYNEIRSWTNG